MTIVRRIGCSLRKAYCGLLTLFILVGYYNNSSRTILPSGSLRNLMSKGSWISERTHARRVFSSQIQPKHVPSVSLVNRLMTLNSSSSTKRMCYTGRRKNEIVSHPNCLRPLNGEFRVILNDTVFESKLYNDATTYFTVNPEVWQSLITEYIIVPKIDCPYLLAIQASILNNRNDRDVVRRTWGSVAKEQIWPNRVINANVQIIFVVARNSRNRFDEDDESLTRYNDFSHRFEEIRSESELYKDILFINMVDSYRNLTLKLLSAYKWVKDNCPTVKFVLKVDFDTFVHVPLLVDTLLYFEKDFEFSIIGRADDKELFVKREGKWAVDASLYPMPTLPIRVSGCGYVMSYRAMAEIVDAAPHFRLIPVEDVFITGIMRRVIGCTLFSCKQILTRCHGPTRKICFFLEDRWLLGMSLKGMRHQAIWDTFVQGSCTTDEASQRNV